MKEQFTFITGNSAKAEQLEKYLAQTVLHQNIDLQEIQSLDIEEVVKEKARVAYEKLKKPILVDDNALIISSLGKLPGTFIKFFEQELGYEKICKLVDTFNDRSAEAIVTLGFCDATQTKTFTGIITGRISDYPKGSGGFGWDNIFIPQGFDQTRAEMNEEDYDKTSPRRIALEYFTSFLKQ